MKIVLDTDVVIAAVRSATGASAELLRFVKQGRCRPIVSVALALEYEAVLFRPEHMLAARLDARMANDVLNGLLNIAEHTEVHYRYRPVVRDPADDLVVEAAINGGASAIVTFNLRDFGSEPARYGIRCLLPREALEMLR